MEKFKDEWVSLKDVEFIYEEINLSSLSVIVHKHRKQGKNISSWYRSNMKKGKASEAYVNVGFFKYTWERRRKIQFEGQDYYWVLLEMYGESKLVKKFANYIDSSIQYVYRFFRQWLFENTYYIKLNDINVKKVYVEFHNFCTEELSEISFDNIGEECDYYEAKRIKNNILYKGAENESWVINGYA